MIKTIAIIGGGASGLMCAVTAARSAASQGKSARIVIIEKNPRVGKKLLVTGNGKCNLANTDERISAYHSNDISCVEGILRKFDAAKIMDFFGGLGVVCVRANGTCVYPRSMQASSVLDALRFEAERLGAEMLCGFDVKKIKCTDNAYIISSDNNSINADMVVIASGSEAGGGCGSGLTLLKNLGHKLYPTYPALTAIKCDNRFLKTAQGMRSNANISLIVDRKIAGSEFGEVLFCDYGISGIAAMQLSGTISKLLCVGKKHDIRLSLDLVYEYSYDELYSYLQRRRAMFPHLELEHFLNGFINKRVAMTALKAADIGALNTSAALLSNADLKTLAHTLKAFELSVTGVKGAPSAQVMGGGAALSDFDDATLESKKIRGLYACGEVLDCCGDCGGYNLTWAWASGFVCGRSAAENL